MHIERFRIQGFKSIADLTVEGLSEINIFFGLNDVGKSNVIQALDMWYWVLCEGEKSTSKGTRPVLFEISLERLEAHFGSSLIRLGHKKKVHITVELTGTSPNIVLVKGEQRLVVELTIQFLPSEVKCELKSTVVDDNVELDKRISIGQILLGLPGFHVVHAARRLQNEQRTNQSQQDTISDKNLKQALFYAYLSSNVEQKKRLNSIKQILAEPPYELGELDIALDPATDRIDIGFVRPDGRLPIENLGSGAQQLILVLGQIFLNDYPIVAVEEPEMNLSPQHQEHLMATLRKLMQDPAVKLQQLFIATHSPYLEFTDNFYDVTYDPAKGTQVKRAALEDYAQHFAIIPAGDDAGARVNSLGQVKLYDGVLRDLGLQRGDLVIFVRNDAGGWEIRSAREVANELQAVTNGSSRA